MWQEIDIQQNPTVIILQYIKSNKYKLVCHVQLTNLLLLRLPFLL